MHFEQPLQEARLLRRYKRFLADVQTEDGRQLTLHCPNTGSMRNCADPGCRVWFRDSQNPSRKYPCTWELVEVEGRYLACVNTTRANALVAEALQDDRVPELSGYARVRAEVPYGAERSRIDFLLEGSGVPCYVEVKSVTLLRSAGAGAFPDAVSQRGSKHLRELMAIAASGLRAVLFYCVPHTGIDYVEPARDIDPVYAATLAEAAAAGVEVLAYRACIDNLGIALDCKLPVKLG